MGRTISTVKSIFAEAQVTGKTGRFFAKELSESR